MSTAPADRTRLRVEIAKDIAACRATLPLQREAFGDAAVVPPELLLAAARNGGFVALGYADAKESPAGFVYGFLGIYDFHFRHHSHLLAVHPERRGSGLALALKEAQRDHCLDQGIEVMSWYLDPLDARHARFTFAKLGAYAREYHRDWNGPGTDRLYVEWAVGHERSYRRLRGEDRPPTLEAAEAEGIRYVLGDGRHDPPRGEGHLLLALPRGISDDEKSTVRDAFEDAFAAGYAAVELLRGSDGRCAYLLVPQPRPQEPPAESQ